MDPFTIAMIGSTALSIYGNYRANMDEAQAEAQNAAWMREQQEMIRKSTEREIGIYSRDASAQIAAMESAFAKSGISMEGSAMELRQQNEILKNLEIDAITQQGQMQLREASLKIGASERKQSQLTSGFNNAIQAIAIGVPGAVSARKVYQDEKAYKAAKAPKKPSLTKE